MKNALKALGLFGGLALAGTAHAAIYINEIYINPPDGDDAREFVELYSTDPAGDSLSNVWLLNFEGDSKTKRGMIDNAQNLTGLSFGSNGYLILGQNYATSTPWGALIPAATNKANWTLPTTEANSIENGAVSFLLVNNFTGSQLTDIDTEVINITGAGTYGGNGTLDSTPWSSVIDSIGWRDGNSYFPGDLDNNAGTPNVTVLDAVYAPSGSLPTMVDSDGVTTNTGTYDYVARFPGNTTANDFNAWYGSDIFAPEASAALRLLDTAADITKRSPNFPLASPSFTAGSLTPGGPNSPTAIPEPASLALLGLGGLAMLRRRRA